MSRKRNPPDTQSADRGRSKRLSLSPLTLEDALRGAMATGKQPEQPKRKRTATKQKDSDMAIWELEPVAPGDPSWRGSDYSGRTTIRAESEDRARYIAWQTLWVGTTPQSVGQDPPRGPWKDPAMARCRRLEGSRYSSDGPEGILEPARYNEEWERMRSAGVV